MQPACPHRLLTSAILVQSWEMMQESLRCSVCLSLAMQQPTVRAHAFTPCAWARGHGHHCAAQSHGAGARLPG